LTQNFFIILILVYTNIGERALVTKEARTANVIACGTVECLVLDRNSFQLLLADVQDDINGEMKTREAKDAIRRNSEEGVQINIYICMFACTPYVSIHI
jgi:hypothetical protein